jgi:hypothetical protein
MSFGRALGKLYESRDCGDPPATPNLLENDFPGTDAQSTAAYALLDD